MKSAKRFDSCNSLIQIHKAQNDRIRELRKERTNHFEEKFDCIKQTF